MSAISRNPFIGARFCIFFFALVFCHNFVFVLSRIIPGRGLKLKFTTHVLAGQNPPRSQYRGDGDSSGHAHHQCFPGRWDDPFARQGHTLRRHRRGAGSESAERYCGRLKSLIIIHRGNRQPPPVTARRTFRLVSSCSFFGQNHRTPVNADTAFHRKSGLVSVYGKQT